MTRSELEHIIRAAGAIARDREIVVIGSQAVLGQYPDAPAALLASMEADVSPLNHPERADKIDGAGRFLVPALVDVYARAEGSANFTPGHPATAAEARSRAVDSTSCCRPASGPPISMAMLAAIGPALG